MRLKFKIKCDFNITFIYGKSDFLINYYARDYRQRNRMCNKKCDKNWV